MQTYWKAAKTPRNGPVSSSKNPHRISVDGVVKQANVSDVVRQS